MVRISPLLVAILPRSIAGQDDEVGMLSINRASLLEDVVDQDDELGMLSMRRVSISEDQMEPDPLMSIDRNQLSSMNASQMVGMVQESVRQRLRGDGIDSNFKHLLQDVKDQLVKQIKDTLLKETQDDEQLVGDLNNCFAQAKGKLTTDSAATATKKEAVAKHRKDLKTCRARVYDLYVKKINACEALDNFIANLQIPVHQEQFDQECVWSEADQVGAHLKTGWTWFQNNHELWKIRNKACVDAVKAYAEKDEECDDIQLEYEQSSCAHRQQQFNACNDHYMTACSTCSQQFDETVKQVECREKDRKVDWSAAEKTECYVNVILASPTTAELKASCDAAAADDEKECATQWRVNQYKACETLCQEVDYHNPDGYEVVDGVNTTHRSSDAAAENRCTRDMDVHFPGKAACQVCPDLPNYACQDAFKNSLPYSEYTSTDWVKELDASTKECADYTHQEQFAYNMETCHTCGDLIGDDPVDVDQGEQFAGAEDAQGPMCNGFVYGDELLIKKEGHADYIGFSEVFLDGVSVQGLVESGSMASVWSGSYYVENCFDGGPPGAGAHCCTAGGNDLWISLKFNTLRRFCSIQYETHWPGARMANMDLEILHQGVVMYTFPRIEEVLRWYNYTVPATQETTTVVQPATALGHFVAVGESNNGWYPDCSIHIGDGMTFEECSQHCLDHGTECGGWERWRPAHRCYIFTKPQSQLDTECSFSQVSTCDRHTRVH